jgi:hypothetical protein
MFNANHAAHAIAPTWMVALNVLGETLHIVDGSAWHNLKKGMPNSTVEYMQKKLQNAVAILVLNYSHSHSRSPGCERAQMHMHYSVLREPHGSDERWHVHTA